MIMSPSSSTDARGRRWWVKALEPSTAILLSLLPPLSFLLLARLSAFRCFSSFPGLSYEDAGLFFMFCNFVFLYILVFSVSIAAFIHAFIRPLLKRQLPLRDYYHGRDDGHLPGEEENSIPGCGDVCFRVLLVLPVCFGLGIEFQLGETSSSTGVIIPCGPTAFFLAVGLHETMLYWSKRVVKPVVDEWFQGKAKSSEEGKTRLVQKVGMALALGGLWWWRLRNHIGSLSAAAESDGVGTGVIDVARWLLYYLLMCLGAIRVVTGVVWVSRSVLVLPLMRKKKLIEKAEQKSISADESCPC